MINLLKIRHWKLFIILTFFVFASMFIAETNIRIGNFDSIQLSVVFRIIGIIILFLWLFLIGIKLNKIENNPFHFSSALLALAVFSTAFNYIHMNLPMIWTENYPIPFYIGAISMPFSIWGIIYIFSRIPKSLNSIENKKIANISDYIKDTFLLFFFPIGIWFVQPRINKISGQKIEINEK